MTCPQSRGSTKLSRTRPLDVPTTWRRPGSTTEKISFISTLLPPPFSRNSTVAGDGRRGAGGSPPSSHPAGTASAARPLPVAPVGALPDAPAAVAGPAVAAPPPVLAPVPPASPGPLAAAGGGAGWAGPTSNIGSWRGPVTGPPTLEKSSSTSPKRAPRGPIECSRTLASSYIGAASVPGDRRRGPAAAGGPVVEARSREGTDGGPLRHRHAPRPGLPWSPPDRRRTRARPRPGGRGRTGRLAGRRRGRRR